MKSIVEVMCTDLFGSADYVLIIYSIVRKWGILSLSFTNWLIFSKQIIMQLGLARNYKPSALKTSVNEVFQYLILLAATSNCKKNCQCTSIREPSKSRAQLRLIANWHEIFIITKRSTFNWNLKKKGIGKAGVAKFRFQTVSFW